MAARRGILSLLCLIQTHNFIPAMQIVSKVCCQLVLPPSTPPAPPLMPLEQRYLPHGGHLTHVGPVLFQWGVIQNGRPLGSVCSGVALPSIEERWKQVVFSCGGEEDERMPTGTWYCLCNKGSVVPSNLVSYLVNQQYTNNTLWLSTESSSTFMGLASPPL